MSGEFFNGLLSGDPRRHAIAITCHNLGWLHHHVPDWTDRHLLSIIDADDEYDQAAFWAGFFWNPTITSAELYSRLKPALLALAKKRDSSREGYVQALAYFVLTGWINAERLLSNEECRDVLLHGGDEFRSHTIWQLERARDESEGTKLDEWVARSEQLFRDVWPRQRSVKNPTMSARLVALLLSNADHFPKLAEVVEPHLTKFGQGHDLYVPREIDEVADKHPESLLSVLYVVLPDEVTNWPYGIGDVLEKIGDADEKLHSDARLRELRRKWNAR